MTVQLHVGYIGKTRTGERVEIVRENIPMSYKEAQESYDVFYSSRGDTYNEYGGIVEVNLNSHSIDIIGPWEEPAAKVGEWIGWNGGECPVHPETVVECVWSNGTGEGKAGSYYWTHTVGPRTIIAYRVITPYVEPKKAREFWLAERKGMMIEVHCHVSDAIHVREVLDDE